MDKDLSQRLVSHSVGGALCASNDVMGSASTCCDSAFVFKPIATHTSPPLSLMNCLVDNFRRRLAGPTCSYSVTPHSMSDYGHMQCMVMGSTAHSSASRVLDAGDSLEDARMADGDV